MDLKTRAHRPNVERALPELVGSANEWSGDRTLFVLTPLDDAANEGRADAPAER